jgi:hypothetical protein
MSYVGNTPFTAAFQTDTFSGNGSTVAFTMSVAPANTSSIIVAVTGVVQAPSTYSVSGTTLTFSAAPPTGTSNISVRYLGIPASGVTTTAYRTVTDTTATAGQTTFSIPSYTVGYISVFRNGSRLAGSDYTATSGTSVILANAASAGDTITTESFYVSSVLNALPNTGGTVSGQLTVNSATGQKPLIAQVNGTEVFEVDASGNVGIGTSSPAYKLDVAQTSGDAVARVFANATTTSSRVEITNGNGTTALNYSYLRLINSKTTSQDWRFGTYGSDNLSFVNVTAGTTPMTLDTSGNLLVGTTSQLYATSAKLNIYFNSASEWGITFKTSSTSGASAAYFINSSGTAVGNISYSTTTTTYATSSDYRLKNTIAPMTGALEKVALLKPCTYKWNADGSDGEGFIAHELAEVCPNAVHGNKDAVDAEGNPVYQGIDTSFLVATLTAAIQEQQALITQLQADVAALKGNA